MIFSVIIPTRNRYENLLHTIDAIKNQTLPQEEFELIVSDDNSTDETKNIYHNVLKDNFKRAKYVNNNYKEHTWNASVPRNLGAALADPDSAAFIFVDSDVRLPVTALEHFKEDYNDNPHRVVLGPYDFMAQDDEHVQTGEVRMEKFDRVDRNDLFESVHDGLACFGGNIMIPRDIFWSVGGFSPDVHIGLEDGDMGLKLWKIGTKFSYDRRLYAKHRWHEQPKDRFPVDMKNHIDKLNLKHFHTTLPDYGIIEATRETFASWGMTGWNPPESWKKMGFNRHTTK